MSITQERKAELITEYGKNENTLKIIKRILDHAVVFWLWLANAVVYLIISRLAILQPTKT